jgi:uncharacterized protein (TIGR02246 family)
MKQIEEMLRRLTQEWYEAENNKDIDAYMSYVADDCVMHPPGAPAVIGKEALRQLVEPYIQSLVSVVGNTKHVVVASSGDMAYEIGDQQMVMAGPDGEIKGETKYVLVWQKLADKWQCAVMSFNYNESMS